MKPRLLLVVTLLMAGCGAATVRKPPAPEGIFGLWSLLDGSTVVMRVRGAPAGGAPSIEAWAGDDKSRFEVTQVSFDGRHLRAMFRYPATGVTTTSELDFVGEDRLEGTVSGSYTGRETWVRTGP